MALQRGRTSAVDKTLALLKQLWLIVGSQHLQQCCRSVRSIVTDMGVEKLIPRIGIEVLAAFLQAMGSPVFVDTSSPYIFSSALHIPGWKHTFDLLLRKGLWTLDWFPKFIGQVKSIISFLRDDIGNVVMDLRRRSMPALAKLMQKVRLPRFADWRWVTLDDCCKSLVSFVSSWSRAFDPSLFAKGRDAVKLKSVCEALQSPHFHRQLKAIAWYSNSMTILLKWGGSCRCHDQFSPQKDRDSCNMKGRLLSEAHPFAMAHLRVAVAECEGWAPGMCDGDTILVRQMQACMKATFLLAEEKLEVFNQIPCLLSRLHEPNIRDACLAQWNEAAWEDHDPVSIEFLAPGSLLRRDIEAMGSDGSGMSPRLTEAWQSLRMVVLDDTPGESPHASMRHTALKVRASSWPWQAASNRLRQNLVDLDFFIDDVHPRTDLQYLWDHTGTLLQTRLGNKGQRNAKMTRRSRELAVYTMYGDEKIDVRALPGERSGSGSDDEGGDDGRPGRDDDADIAGIDRAWAQMLRDFYKKAFAARAGHFYSIRSEVDHAHRPFQLLNFRPVVALARSHRRKKAWTCKMSVQMLDTWRERDMSSRPQLDVLVVSDAENIDLGHFVTSAEKRQNVYQWEEVACDVEGCLSLVNPRRLEVTENLNGRRVPVLCLIDRLKADGWVFVDAVRNHRPEGLSRIADGRKFQAKRHYLQCLLAQQTL